MKSIGIVRKVDGLGRVVIPKELRKTMDINTQDPMEIYVEGNNIIFKKYSPGCSFCNSMEETIEFKGQTLCKNCISKLKDMDNG